MKWQGRSSRASYGVWSSSSPWDKCNRRFAAPRTPPRCLPGDRTGGAASESRPVQEKFRRRHATPPEMCVPATAALCHRRRVSNVTPGTRDAPRRRGASLAHGRSVLGQEAFADARAIGVHPGPLTVLGERRRPSSCTPARTARSRTAGCQSRIPVSAARSARRNPSRASGSPCIRKRRGRGVGATAGQPAPRMLFPWAVQVSPDDRKA